MIYDENGVHQGLKTFSCKSFAKTYTTPHAIRNHINNDHKGKRFPCQFCDKVFTQNQSLTRHIKNDYCEGLKQEKSVVHTNGIKNGTDIDTINEQNIEPKIETMNDQNIESKTEPKIEPKTESKTESNIEPNNKRMRYQTVYKCEACNITFNTRKYYALHTSKLHISNFEFSPEQLLQLEAIFRRKQLINIFEIEQLAKSGNFPEDEVQKWFANKRRSVGKALHFEPKMTKNELVPKKKIEPETKLNIEIKTEQKIEPEVEPKIEQEIEAKTEQKIEPNI